MNLGKETEGSPDPINPTIVDPRMLPNGLFYIREGFLSPSFCAELRDEMKLRPAPPVGSIDLEGKATLVEEIRKTLKVDVSKDTRKAVDDIVSDLLDPLSEHFHLSNPLSRFEPTQFLLYPVGHYFNEHPDNPDPNAPDEFRNRFVSVSLFLNGEDTYSGGSLAFKIPFGRGIRWISVKGTEGLLVAFRSQLHHAVTPMTQGERFSIVTWCS